VKGSIHSALQELYIVPVHVLPVTLHTRRVSSERRTNLFIVLKPCSVPFVKSQPCWHHFKSGYLASRVVIYVSCSLLYDQAMYSKTTETCRQRCAKGKVYVCTEHVTSQPNNRRAEGGVDVLSVGLSIPALTASLGSVSGTWNYNWDCAYANDLPSRLKNPTWEHVSNNAHRIYSPARFERWDCLTLKLSFSASVSCLV